MKTSACPVVPSTTLKTRPTPTSVSAASELVPKVGSKDSNFSKRKADKQKSASHCFFGKSWSQVVASE